MIEVCTSRSISCSIGGIQIKKRNKVFLVVILFLILLLIIMCNKTYAVEGYYKDWSKFPKKIDNEYSYSTLYYSKSTVIEVKRDDTIEKYYENEKWVNKNPIELITGENATIKITNCAVDKDGDICDVVIKLDKVKVWTQENGEPWGNPQSKNSIKLSFADALFYDSQKKPIVKVDKEYEEERR